MVSISITQRRPVCPGGCDTWAKRLIARGKARPVYRRAWMVSGEKGIVQMAMKKGVKALVAEAEAEIETLTAAQAVVRRDEPEIVLVDIRDIRELYREGTVPGALHAPRGMLEFWVDPESPYHKEIFASGKHFVFYCAGGLRSALAAKTVQDMGLSPVSHIAGGFAAWKEAGGATEPKEAPKS